jgi:hypothetical protein
MSDVQEQEVVVAETDTPEIDASVREDVNSQEDHSGQPDFKAAMYEERQKRKALEQQLNDPQFVYEQAKRHGLTEREEAELEEEIPSQRSVQRQPAMDVDAVVTRRIRLEKAIDKYPDLVTDNEAGVMVSALIDKGMDPLKAADTVYSRITRQAAEAKAEGAKEKERQIGEKERARTLEGGADLAVDETQALRDRIRNGSKSESGKAMLELMKQRNRQAGIFK